MLPSLASNTFPNTYQRLRHENAHTDSNCQYVFFVCVVYSDIAYKQKRSLQNPSIDFPLSMYPATTVEVWECRNVSARVSRTTTITNSNFPCLRYWTLNTNIHSHTHTQSISGCHESVRTLFPHVRWINSNMHCVLCNVSPRDVCGAFAHYPHRRLSAEW